MDKPISLTAIVPFYNEEKTLKDSIGRLVSTGIFNQIILSDDLSTDSSSDIAKTFLEEQNNFLYICSKQNDGKGAALKNAQSHIKSTHVIIHDADLEYYPDDIVEMLDISYQHPKSLVLGSRFIGDKIRENGYIRTYYANKILSAFFSLINFYKVTDVATCYKLMPSDFFQNLDIKERGFSIEIEILSKFLKYNRSIKESPIRYSGRSYEEGKKIKISDGFFYLLNTLRYKFFQ